MARGTKNYFRHSFNAFDDEKIQKAISLLGFEGYAYYFIILELCAKQCENEFKSSITFHKQTVRTVLRKQNKSCDKVLTLLQQSGLFVVTFSESFYEFNIPNLAKYMGRYESKMSLNAPNKRKENKIKENKIKEKENKEKAATGNVEIDENCGIAKTHGVIEEFSCLVDQAKEYAEKIPEKQQRKLVYDYGEELASRYILKLAEWDSRQPQSRRKKDYYLTIVKWLGDAGIESKSSIEKRQDALNKKIAKMDAEARARNESHV